MRKLRKPAAWLGAAIVALAAASAQPLPRSRPESQGVASSALNALIQTLDRQIDGMHSIMIVRHGHVIAEGWWKPYDASHNHVLYSLSKSFTSTAVGLAVAEHRLGIDDEIVRFFPNETPTNAPSNLKAMRVRDILTMATGHQDEPPTSPDAMSPASFLAQAVPHRPGTHFKYNTAATFMQSAIVQHLTGQTILDYLQPRLFQPLGIEHPVWDTNHQGISLGGYGLRVRTEDIAKFGQLYLQKGRWNGRQLIPAAWIDQATSRQVSNGSNPNSDWEQGYGFQFWRCRHQAFRGDGAFGQYCVVLPGQDAVIAITSGVRDMQAVLNVLWESFLPACTPRRLRSRESELAALRSTLARLEVKPAAGAATGNPGTAGFRRRYSFPANDQNLGNVTLAAAPDRPDLSLTLRLDGRDVTLPAGHGKWLHARGPFPAGRLAQFPSEPIAGTFGWTSPDTLEVKFCAVETPFHLTYRLKFEGDQVILDAETNVAFGPTRRPTLVGRTEP